ncbi:MAG TPA: carbonic anhydrase [Polyangiaceae bacterium]|nr:carbonic anhydrase [Polyangiaceae bacterium]
MSSSKRIAKQLLDRLLLGNGRYVSSRDTAAQRWQKRAAVERRHPFAAVLVCSDIGVVPERMFDLEPGALYVLQSAANVVGEAEAAGALFASHQYGIELFLVIGHTPCAACAAAVDRSQPQTLTALDATAAHLVRHTDEPDDASSFLARAHAVRMAHDLRSKVIDVQASVVAAHLDERSGRIRLLQDA